MQSRLSSLFNFSGNQVTAATIPFLLFIIYQYLNGNFSFKRSDRSSLYLFVFTILVLACEFIFNQSNLMYIISFAVIPCLLYLYCDNLSDEEIVIIRRILIFVLILDTSIALYERITLTNLFAEDEYAGMDKFGNEWSFRSPALFGHPLANAMILTSINIFILASKRIVKNKTKLFYFVVTLIALLSFNERGNIILFTATSTPFLYDIFKKGKSSFKVVFLLFVILMFGAYNFLSSSDYGGRIFNHEIKVNDGSMMARKLAFDIFRHLDNDVLFWGVDDSMYLKLINSTIGMNYIENGVIVVLIRCGIICGIPMLISLFAFQLAKLKVYKKWEIALFLILFYVIGLSNPHISKGIQWEFFFLSYYAFKPSYSLGHG